MITKDITKKLLQVLKFPKSNIVHNTPLSMNRLANLAKQHRVIAPKVSHKLPLDPNTTKENQSRATISMGELILTNKGQQRQRKVFKQNMEKPNYITCGAKRRLVLVDEDDDENNEISQVDMEQDGRKDDENERDIIRSQDDVDHDDEYEDMDHMTFANFENDIQGDDSDEDMEMRMMS